MDRGSVLGYDPRRAGFTRSAADAAGAEVEAMLRARTRAAAADVELSDEKVEEEFNDERRDVEQAVHATAAEQRQQPITGTIQVDVRISSHLARCSIYPCNPRISEHL